jgi:hypothetical protein
MHIYLLQKNIDELNLGTLNKINHSTNYFRFAIGFAKISYMY